MKPPTYPDLAANEARRLGLHRSTLVAAIQSGDCAGEQIGERWHTSQEAADEWYHNHYRHRGTLLSQAAGRSWSAAEEARLVAMLTAGEPLADIARDLKRAESAVKSKATRLRQAGRLAEAKEIKVATKEAARLDEARQLVAKAAVAEVARPAARSPPGYQRPDSRMRLHVPADVLALLQGAARSHGISLTRFMILAGLAAAEDGSRIRAMMAAENRLNTNRG